MAVENSNPTPEQIAEWKAKHGEIFLIESEDGSWCCLCKPSRTTIEAYTAQSKNPVKALETIVKNSWVAGDDTFKTDVYKLLSVAEQIDEIVEIKKTTLKKL
jgi:hypothetical protein